MGALLILLLSMPILIIGCASGSPEEFNNSTLILTLTVDQRGEIDTWGRGYYAILFNGFSEEIEVTNYETFTDFIRYDGFNFTWYHRQGNVPSPGYTWVDAGNMNDDGLISSDGNSIIIRIDLNDRTSLLNQYIESRRFTIHAVTTDKSDNLLGRAIDTLGRGPSFGGNSLYTLFFDKSTGLLSPLPSGYPMDPVGDYSVKPQLGSDFPYENFDIESFTVELE